MKHQYRLDFASEAATRELRQTNALLADLDRGLRIIDADIASEEQRTGISDLRNPAYPILARTLAVRKDNLQSTVDSLVRRIEAIKNQLPALELEAA